jgi:hypothetical protein
MMWGSDVVADFFLVLVLADTVPVTVGTYTTMAECQVELKPLTEQGAPFAASGMPRTSNRIGSMARALAFGTG